MSNTIQILATPDQAAPALPGSGGSPLADFAVWPPYWREALLNRLDQVIFHLAEISMMKHAMQRAITYQIKNKIP